MAGGAERVLRRRIRSIESTKKITNAMQLISASRIVSAQARVAAARPYSEQITEVMRNLAAAGAGGDQPLLTERDDVRKVAFVVVAGDRGLAGGYNANIVRAAEQTIKGHQAQGRDYSLILVGKKIDDAFRFRGYTIDAAFRGFSGAPTYDDAKAVAAEVVERFQSGEVDQVELIYTQFLSVASQRVQVRRFLPLEQISVEEAAAAGPSADYEFEPSPSAILAEIAPRYIEARLYAALLDAAASEHAARQRAMKSATDNAEELIKVLSRRMNRARQDAITTEIIEIASGAEALAQAASGEVDLLHDRPQTTDVFRRMNRDLDRREHHAS